MEWQAIRWLEPSSRTYTGLAGSLYTRRSQAVAHTQTHCVQAAMCVICAMTIVPFAAITKPFWGNHNELDSDLKFACMVASNVQADIYSV